MKKVIVEITGTTPLLMNNPIGLISKKKQTLTTEKRDAFEEAKALLYADEKGKLFVPSVAIKGCLINAASYRKFGKYAARPIVAGGIIISPDKIYLNTNKWDVDIRSVVIQRARIAKARPKVSDWKLTFELLYNERLIQSPDLIKPLLEDAGERIGILDFRPAKTGSFGMFKVTKWNEE